MDSHPIREVFFAFCKTADTPVTLGLWLRYKHGEHAALASMTINPRDYCNSDRFHLDYTALSFLRKYEGLETGIDTKKAALEAFTTFERQCKATNEAFRNNLRGFSPRVHAVFHSMIRKISSLLGPLDVARVLSECRWGNGATMSLSRRKATVDNKISEVPLSVTCQALPYMKAFLESDPHWFSAICGADVEGPYSVLPSCFRVVMGDKYDTVLKDATIRRTIGKTPTANSFLQQGPGRFIRRRLLRAGIDLSNQEINQTWASLAQELDLCTLDLKGASDTNAKEMVSHFLPLDWYLFLDALRSPSIQVEGKWLRLEKFSAMGTAFTFELESLIFWAAVSAATELSDPGGVVSVYGDDIICTKRASTLVIETLEALGFTINLRKSYVDGVFYESCGKHYFDGDEVTPIFQKEVFNEKSDDSVAIRLGNRLYRLVRRCTLVRHRGTARAADRALDACRRVARPTSHQFEIPDTCEGDEGWLTPWWLLPSDFCENHGILCRVLLPRVKTRIGKSRALLAHWLRNADKASRDVLSVSRVDVRSHKQRYKPAWRWIAPHTVL